MFYHNHYLCIFHIIFRGDRVRLLFYVVNISFIYWIISTILNFMKYEIIAGADLQRASYLKDSSSSWSMLFYIVRYIVDIFWFKCIIIAHRHGQLIGYSKSISIAWCQPPSCNPLTGSYKVDCSHAGLIILKIALFFNFF